MQFDKKIKPFQGFAGFGVSNYRFIGFLDDLFYCLTAVLISSINNYIPDSNMFLSKSLLQPSLVRICVKFLDFVWLLV